MLSSFLRSEAATMSGQSSTEPGNPADHLQVRPFAKICSVEGGRVIFALDDYSPEELRLIYLEVINSHSWSR